MIWGQLSQQRYDPKHFLGCGVPVPSREETVFEVFPDGCVVKFQGSISHADSCKENAYAYKQMGAERQRGMSLRPTHIEIDERIMGDVERIGYFTEKLTHLNCAAPFERAAGSGHHYDREYQQYGSETIESVKNIRRISDMRHAEGGGKYKRTEQESARAESDS